MPNFKCVNCGAGSLVRSNFRLTPTGITFCKRPDCEKQRLHYLQANSLSETESFIGQTIHVSLSAEDSTG